MPELPEVQTIVDTLADRLVGARIEAVSLNRRDIVTPGDLDLVQLLMNQRIVRIWRRAKRVMVQLESGDRFYVHLGMSGRLTIEPSDQNLRPHTHLVMVVGGHRVCFRDPRRFGGIWWLGRTGDEQADLGPEPLDMQAGELFDRLKKTRRAIKTALLDQSLIAGLGNIYADESLFAARIHPRRMASRLTRDEVERLNRAIKEVLNRAIKHRGSTLRDYVDANGSRGGFQKLHRVYGREGQPCLVCGAAIKKIILGGRSTHFCARCQKRK